MELMDLPNIGPVLAENLRRVDITSAEELRLLRPGGVPPHPCPSGPYCLLSPADGIGRRGAGRPQDGSDTRAEGGPAGVF